MNNSFLAKSQIKPNEFKDVVHIPSQADGYCLLTLLEALKNTTTCKLMVELDIVSNKLGGKYLENWNSKKAKAQSGAGIDSANIWKLKPEN
jgi:hypothetical protein